MQMHEVDEVCQVAGANNANTKLAEGWTLLAVTSADNSESRSMVFYVLGRKAQKARPTTQGAVQTDVRDR
ncbi:hypothetical protein D3C81_2143190 [compost metagenome]